MFVCMCVYVCTRVCLCVCLDLDRCAQGEDNSYSKSIDSLFKSLSL